MKTESIMIIKKSTAIETIKELGDVITNEDVLLKIIPDTEFNLIFGHTETIELDLEEEIQFELMRIAHEKGITLDLLINQILLDKINEVEKKGLNITAKADTSMEIKMEDLKREVNDTIIKRSEEDSLEKLIDDVCK